METILLIGVVVLFLCGAPLFSVILAFTLLGALATTRTDIWESFNSNLIDVIGLGTGDKAKILSTIPLFIVAGYILAESKTADRMVRAAQSALGWLPGGLAIVTIFACAAFTTFTGASGVTIVALGGLVLPALVKESYPKRFSLGLVAGTGSVGLLFPPAVPLFVYATVYSIAYQGVRKVDPTALPLEADRFIFAGIVPGMVLLGILSLYAVAVAIKRKVPRHRFDPGSLGHSMIKAAPEILLPVFIIAAIANGIDIPEIASLTVVYVLIIEMFVYKDIKPRALLKITKDSMSLVGAIFIIIFAAQALANYFVTAKIPDAMVDFFTTHIEADQWWLFLLAVNGILLLAGMVMDIFSAIVIIVPLIALPAHQFGIDPYHLGVIFLLNLEIGYITPPVGLNLFITSFKFKRPILEVTQATMPFLFCMVAALVLVTYIPALTIVPPAKPTGTIQVLSELVREQHQTLGAVATISMPDGTEKKLSDCAKEKGDLARGKCEAIFLEVTQCGKLDTPEAVSVCEKKAIADFIEASKSIDDVSTDDLMNSTGDDDDDDDDDDLTAPDGDSDDDDDGEELVAPDETVETGSTP